MKAGDNAVVVANAINKNSPEVDPRNNENLRGGQNCRFRRSYYNSDYHLDDKSFAMQFKFS